MRRLSAPSVTQYGLIVVLFTLLLGGLLLPGGNAQAGALVGTVVMGTPLANGTPLPVRPAPPAPAAPPVLSGTPEATPTAAPASLTPATSPVASPIFTVATVGPTATPTTLPRGSVSASIIRDLSPLAFTLNGQTQVAQATMDVAVNDTAPTMQQPGWSLSLTVERFRVAGFPARTLPANAVTVLGVTVTCVGTAACTTPENTVAYPLAMPADRAVPIYTAAPGSGSGQFVVTPTFAVMVPGNAYAGNYGTSIAVAVVGGPSTPVGRAPAATPASVVALSVPPSPTDVPTALPGPPMMGGPTPTPLALPTARPTPASPRPPRIEPIAATPTPLIALEPRAVSEPTIDDLCMGGRAALTAFRSAG